MNKTKSATPRTPAAFINTLYEIGSREEIIGYLQKTWDERCQFERELAEAKEELEKKASMPDILAMQDGALVRDLRVALKQAEQRLAEAEKILDWLEEHGRSDGGGNGFTYTVFVPVDCEHLGSAILTAIAQEKK